MAKNKNRRQLASKRQRFELKAKTRTDVKSDSKMSSVSSDVNPFEFHRNKVKHNIIGRHLATNEIGNKGLSRNRSHTKRKNTLLREYKTKHKSGKGLQDLRNKDTEEVKRLNDSIDLQFNDNTVLTHKGKHLNDFIDDRIGSDDEDIDFFSRAEFVETTHFGGGSDGRPKSANEVLSQIMDEKREKQLERQANIELTEELDRQWISVKNIVRHKGVKHEVKDNTREDFDILVKELMFRSDNKPIVPLKPITKSSVESVGNEMVATIEKNSDSLFKDMIQSIEHMSDWTQILEVFNKMIDLLPEISDKCLSVLTEKYQTMIETKSGFNANNFVYLMIGTHFKQTKLIIDLIFIKIINKIKYKTLKDIGIALVIIKVLVMTSNGKYIPEVFNAILNIICLTQTQQTIESIIGYKTKLKCILDLNGLSVEEKTLNFRVNYIFDKSFNNFEIFSEKQIKSMLFLECLQRVEEILELYSNVPSLYELSTPLKGVCSLIDSNALPEDIKQLLDRVLTKLSSEQPKAPMVESRPKPFMLPMFEPKFDDNNNSKDKKSSKKRLVKKYSRELKGAKRELRKDSAFMRNTWIHEMKSNDEIRKRKVKQLFGDLAQEKGFYKKSQ